MSRLSPPCTDLYEFVIDLSGDDARFAERPGATSPPYPGIGLKDGEPLREDWFPVVWRVAVAA